MLQCKKSPQQTISQCIREIFTVNALSGYNYSGVNCSRKKVMKNYEIFTSCMLEAWANMDESTLATQLREATIRASTRLRQKRFRERKEKAKKMSNR